MKHWQEQFPRLKIIMEHITTADAVTLLDRYENLHAIDVAALIITLMWPEACSTPPILQTHRQATWKIATPCYRRPFRLIRN